MSISIVKVLKLINLRYMFLILVLLSGLIPISGCSSKNFLSIPIKGEHGEIHYLVVGIGMVTIPGPNKKIAIHATKSQALGLIVSNQPDLKLGLGYSVSNVVAVPDGAVDVRVEISQKPFGPLKLDAKSAILDETKN